MGFFDFKGTPATCPACGSRRAARLLWKTKCPNPNCRNFDSAHAELANQNRIENKDAVSVFPHLRGDFVPGSNAIRIRYENFRGDHLNYLADAQGAYRTGEHLVIRVAPTGRRIAFQFASILNRGEVERSLPTVAQAGSSRGNQPLPDADERRILNHHLRRGTSSPRFIEVRQKFPDYQP